MKTPSTSSNFSAFLRSAIMRLLLIAVIFGAPALPGVASAQVVSPYQFATVKRGFVDKERTAVGDMVYTTNEALDILRSKRAQNTMLLCGLLAVAALIYGLSHAAKGFGAATAILWVLNYPYSFLLVFAPLAIFMMRRWNREDNLVLFRQSSSVDGLVDLSKTADKKGSDDVSDADRIANAILVNKASGAMPKISRPM